MAPAGPAPQEGFGRSLPCGAQHHRHGAELRAVAGSRSGQGPQTSISSSAANSWTDYGLPECRHVHRTRLSSSAPISGLGGGGKHQYSIAGTNGRDAIDSVRAAVSLWPAIGAGRKAVMYGWSQGGGADAGRGKPAGLYRPDGDGGRRRRVFSASSASPPTTSPRWRRKRLRRGVGREAPGSTGQLLRANVFNFTHFMMAHHGPTRRRFRPALTPILFTEDGAGSSTRSSRRNGCTSPRHAELTRRRRLQVAAAGRSRSVLRPVEGADQGGQRVAAGQAGRAGRPVIYWGTAPHGRCPPAMVGGLHRSRWRPPRQWQSRHVQLRHSEQDVH